MEPHKRFHFLIASRHRSTSCFSSSLRSKKTMSLKKNRSANGKFLPQVRIFSCWKIPRPPSLAFAPALRSYASHPPFSICDIRIQKQINLGLAKTIFWGYGFSQTEINLFFEFAARRRGLGRNPRGLLLIFLASGQLKKEVQKMLKYKCYGKSNSNN